MQKKPIVLIICVTIVVLAMILLIIYLVNGGSLKTKDSIKIGISDFNPEIDLSIEPTDITDGTVTIYIEATQDKENQVESIKLPNGQVVQSANARYEVSKNGEYIFEVNGNKGKAVTKSITVSNINEISADSPYIPEKFKHVEGTTVDTGFIIEDTRGNQYVWVPVKTGALIRNNEGNDQYEEKDNTASGLYNSVAKYYGFYVARYEACKHQENGLSVATSIADEIPWSSVTYEEAYAASINAATIYEYSGVKTALMNSYAWDTTLNWLNQSIQNYASNTSYGNNKGGVIFKTGATQTDQVNSICDMAGNLREWTTEIYNANLPDLNETEEDIEGDMSSQQNSTGYRVVRGGSANINKVANSRIGQAENLSDIYWGFRMIMYKD